MIQKSAFDSFPLFNNLCLCRTIAWMRICLLRFWYTLWKTNITERFIYLRFFLSFQQKVMVFISYNDQKRYFARFGKVLWFICQLFVCYIKTWSKLHNKSSYCNIIFYAWTLKKQTRIANLKNCSALHNIFLTWIYFY